ncbi:MAG: histidine--tRNA ligase [Verrucomicrobia bacterium]|nr:histidine--tRNA ligase [Verrucomicrobiota bacterium]
MKIQIPKGTFDILPYCAEEPWQQSDLWQSVEAVICETAREYGYKEIRTPIYERTELFDRGVGETSDIVSKEMFTFDDKGGRSISLRPEATASVMRSFIEHNLAQAGSIHKLFCLGPMFRYERPQSGRYRQFHQFDVEAIGAAGPEQDAEVIDLLCQIYRRLGLKNLKVRLNTVGDSESRDLYRTALIDYFKPHFEQLSADSKIRLEKNPLRILDSKAPEDKQLVLEAPSILSHLNPASQRHFQEVCRLLDQIEVPYEIDDRIVRGLDYYNKTVFEVTTEDLGAQNTIGAGGRYDGLLATLGGPDLPGIGFATGLERVLQVMLSQKSPVGKKARPLIYFIPLGDEARTKCFLLATQCRHNKIAAEVDLQSKKVQTGLQNATKADAVYCAIVGSDELKSGRLQLKHLESRQTSEANLEQLLNHLQGLVV